ncbi:MAG: hypothetical protein JW829_11685 [Pirellulales bacterium]|nr:hypothetical protein [Pirellulales bacterium]
MSIAEWNAGTSEANMAGTSLPAEAATRPLHRIHEVRQQQGISLRTAARRMSTTIENARSQEKSESDISLSDLYRWQCALGVPVENLLVDLDAPLSMPILQRARLLKMMKTVRSISEQAECESIQRLAETLAQQLIEVMPELKEVSPWHSVGQRRTLNEYGRIVEQTYSDHLFSMPSSDF